MSARDAILNRLKHFQPREAKHAQVNPPNNMGKNNFTRQNFIKSLTDAHAEVIECSALNWPRKLLDLCCQQNWHRIACIAATRHGQLFMAEIAKENQNNKKNSVSLIDFSGQVETFKDTLFNHVDVGLSVAEGGICETGTLIIRITPEEPRTISLVPEVNVILVPLQKLYSSLKDAMKEQQWEENMPSNLVLVSGPSKTADIQQALAYGAHGPKRLIVMLLN